MYHNKFIVCLRVTHSSFSILLGYITEYPHHSDLDDASRRRKLFLKRKTVLSDDPTKMNKLQLQQQTNKQNQNRGLCYEQLSRTLIWLLKSGHLSKLVFLYCACWNHKEVPLTFNIFMLVPQLYSMYAFHVNSYLVQNKLRQRLHVDDQLKNGKMYTFSTTEFRLFNMAQFASSKFSHWNVGVVF